MVYLHSDKENGESKSTLVSRNITVLGRRTSVRLEPEMWNALKDISRRESCRVHDICSLIHMRKKANTSLTAAIRVFLMLYYKAASTEEGHSRAGHGNFKAMLERARIGSEGLAHIKTGGNGQTAPAQHASRPAQRQSLFTGQSKASSQEDVKMQPGFIANEDTTPVVNKQVSGF